MPSVGKIMNIQCVHMYKPRNIFVLLSQDDLTLQGISPCLKKTVLRIQYSDWDGW